MQRRVRRHRGRVAARAFGEQRGGAHFAEQVEAVVARGAVGAEADVDAAREHARDRRDAARELQIGRRAVRDAAAVVREERDLVRLEVHGVHRDQPGPEQSDALQALERPHAVRFQAFADLVVGLVHVHVHRHVELRGVGGHALERVVGDGVGRVRRHAEREQRLVAQRIAHGEALGEVVARVAGVRRRQFDHDHADRRAHAGFAARPAAAASGKKYMSLKQVTPPRSISAHASRVPSRTNAGDTICVSTGQM